MINLLSNSLGVFKREPVTFLSKYRIRESIRNTPTHKACGPDTVKPVVLRNLSDKALTLLGSLYEGCLAAKNTPLLWRKGSVVLIPKSGKEEYQKVNSFPPITLSNHIFKTMEKLDLWDIT